MRARKFHIVRMLLGLGMLAFAAIALATLAASRVTQPSLDVVISEVAWMGTTVSCQDEWIELYNNSNSSIDLTGWTLNADDGKPSIALKGSIPAGGHFLLERTNDDTVPGVDADLIYKNALEDGGEHLILRDASSILIDHVDCSKKWFAGHRKGRVPMMRVDTMDLGSKKSNWTYNPPCGLPTNAAGESHTYTPPKETPIGHALDYAVYFNERFTATTTSTECTAMEVALLNLIGGASTSVDIALYGLNRQSVVDALIAAHRDKNVTVRVVGDDGKRDTGNCSASYEELQQAGITIVTDSSSKLQHNKFLIVDGQTVWTGSANFTDNGLTRNANNSIVITDTTLASIYTAEFEEMWAGNFHKDKADNTARILDYDGTALEIYFSPTDLVACAVWDALASANESIRFAVYSWTDDMLASRVEERLHQGVKVYGVWDALNATGQVSAYETLAGAGAQIKVENFAGKVHHKFAVIDVEGSDPVVILGSYNWTDNGAYDNDENTLIIHDRDLARAYYNEWQRLWSAVGCVVSLPSTALRSMSMSVISLR